MTNQKSRKKGCYFCNKGVNPDYKETEVLKRFLKENGSIKSSKVTGTCAKHQSKVKQEIEKARILALLPIPGKD